MLPSGSRGLFHEPQSPLTPNVCPACFTHFVTCLTLCVLDLGASQGSSVEVPVFGVTCKLRMVFPFRNCWGKKAKEYYVMTCTKIRYHSKCWSPDQNRGHHQAYLLMTCLWCFRAMGPELSSCIRDGMAPRASTPWPLTEQVCR